MKSKAYTTQKGNRTPIIYIIIGLGAALMTTILVSIGLTSLVAKGALPIENIPFVVFITRAIAVLLGTVVTTCLHKGNALLDIGVVCIAYLVVLVAIAITFYEGMFSNFGGGFLSILTGGAAACLIHLKPPKRRNVNRRYAK